MRRKRFATWKNKEIPQWFKMTSTRPERYYDWMIWKLRQSGKKEQEMRKYSNEKKLLEKHET